MNQLNLKIENKDYDTLRVLARQQNLLVTSLAKSIFIESLRHYRIEKAMELYSRGDLGLKAAWKLSGLDFLTFIELMKEHDIEPPIPKEVDEYTTKVAEKLKI